MTIEDTIPAARGDAARVLAGKYRLDQRLGEGGMGIVWSGQNLDLQTRVAIKLLQPRLAEDPVAKARFLREARRAASIEGEHCVRIHDVGTDEASGPYIVMEHLQGETAEARLKRGKLSIQDAATVMLQLVDALAEAHAKGLVHRDIKPANLFLVDKPGETIWVKVLDFGIAKLAAVDGQRSSLNLTAPHTLIGSPHYMSPEQLRDSATVDARSDVWSCGVLLFELVTGVVPFDAPSIADLFAQIVTGAPRTLAVAGAEGVPPPVARLMDRCLRKEPDERPQTAYDLAVALAPYAAPSARALLPRSRAWCKAEIDAADPRPSRSAMMGGLTLVAIAGVVGFVAASWRAPVALGPAASVPLASLAPVTVASLDAGASAALSQPSSAAPASAAPVTSASSAAATSAVAPRRRPPPPSAPAGSANPRIQSLGDIDLIP